MTNSKFSDDWKQATKAAMLMLLLAALMCLDVWLSRDVLVSASETHLEGNALARSIGPHWLLVGKLTVAGLLGAWCVWRQRLFALIVANLTMAIVVAWNTAMLTIF